MALLSRAELSSEAVQRVIAIGDGIRSISHRQGNSMDDLLKIVHVMAERGSADVISRLHISIKLFSLKDSSAGYMEIVTVFGDFIRGPLVDNGHLKKFVDMEADVMTIAQSWRVNDIISVVGAVAEHGTTSVLATLQKGPA